VRALFVAPYLPTPGSGGRTRLINLMQRLGRSHELSIVAMLAADQHPSDLVFEGAALAPPPLRERPGGMRGTMRFYRERFERVPAFVAQTRSEEFAAAVRAECERFRPDVVQIETTEMAQYLSAVPAGPARALDLQDVASRWFGRVAREGAKSKQRALMMWELLKTRRYEVRNTKLADVVFVTSEIERAHLSGLTGVEPVLIPNGVDTSAFAPLGVAEEAGHVLFVGPLSYDANLVGLRWFVDEVLPMLRARVPGVVVDHIGDAAGHRFDGVVSHGFVDDVRPYVARAAVSVVPVRVGSGTRYKILEALSMERAVVSTTVGAEGLGATDGVHLLLADDPVAFATSVAQLLGDPELRALLGRAGRAHVVERYDWEPLVARVEESWERAASTR
jgi:glycosyltransferase involved in cell wall biosynthesis